MFAGCATPPPLQEAVEKAKAEAAKADKEEGEEAGEGEEGELQEASPPGWQAGWPRHAGQLMCMGLCAGLPATLFPCLQGTPFLPPQARSSRRRSSGSSRPAPPRQRRSSSRRPTRPGHPRRRPAARLPRRSTRTLPPTPTPAMARGQRRWRCRTTRWVEDLLACALLNPGRWWEVMAATVLATKHCKRVSKAAALVNLGVLCSKQSTCSDFARQENSPAALCLPTGCRCPAACSRPQRQRLRPTTRRQSAVSAACWLRTSAPGAVLRPALMQPPCCKRWSGALVGPARILHTSCPALLISCRGGCQEAGRGVP